jgi:hypothetical protein
VAMQLQINRAIKFTDMKAILKAAKSEKGRYRAASWNRFTPSKSLHSIALCRSMRLQRSNR